MKPATAYVMCIRANGPSDIPMSVRKKCSECDNDVWMSQATIQAVEESGAKDYRPICDVCAPHFMESQKEQRFMPMTDAQFEELEQTLGGSHGPH